MEGCEKLSPLSLNTYCVPVRFAFTLRYVLIRQFHVDFELVIDSPAHKFQSLFGPRHDDGERQ